MSETLEETTRVRWSWPDWVSCAGLFLLALTIRWPNVLLIPRITDESAEVRWALDIYAGLRLPLTHMDTYNGPLVPYALAGLFHLFGPSISLPRLFVLVIGALTVVATYLLGRAMAGRIAGLVAGGLMATSFSHVVLNSHVAWSNCTTPFFTTVTLWVFYLAVRRGSDRLLILSGLLAGLAMQTHPSVLALFPGMVGWFLLQEDGRRWLRRPTPYVATGASALAYGNMLWFNLTNRFASIAEAANPKNAYVDTPTAWGYVINVRNLLIQLAKMTSGVFRDGYAPLDYLREPAVLIYGGLLLICLIYAARKGHSLPLAVFLSAGLILPCLNRSYEALYDTRYITFLVPVSYVAVGIVADEAWQAVVGWRRQAAVGLAVLALIVFPVASLAGFYQENMDRDLDNRALLGLTDRLTQEQQGGAVIIVDKKLRDLKLGGGGDPGRALDYLLTLDGTPHMFEKLPTINWYLTEASENTYLLPLAEETHAWLAAHHDLEPVYSDLTDSLEFGVYRFAGRPPNP